MWKDNDIIQNHKDKKYKKKEAADVLNKAVNHSDVYFLLSDGM